MSMQAPFMMPNMGMMAPFNVMNKMALAPALYIGDLDESIQEETLYDFFSKFGAIHFVRIMRDTTTGKSRGYGFVNFINPRDAENAKQYAQYEKLGKRQIRIMFKRPIKDLNPESNLYVKNVDPNVTVRELHNHFANSGNVICAKIASDAEGRSLGYGYVQFEKPEDADKALEALQNSKLKEKEISLSKFISKDKRQTATPKTNIYLKDLPNAASTQEIETKIKQVIGGILKNQDKVKSMLAKKHPKENKYCAFVCLEDQQAAQDVFDAIQADPKLFGADHEVYINWHQTKSERERDLKRQHAQTQNQTNLFVKNLRLDVSDEEVKKAFQNFGKVTSVAVKEWTSSTGQKQSKFGFIAFDNADDAKRALTEALKIQEIRNLYLPNASPYINLHQPKDKRSEYLLSTRRKKMQAGMMAPMDMYRMGGFAGPIPNRRFQQPYPPIYAQPGMGRGGPNRGGPRNPTQGGGRPNWNKGGMQQQQGPRGNMGPTGNRPQGVQQQNTNRTGGPNTGNVPTQKPAPTQQAQPKTTPSTSAITVQSLKSKLNEFLALDEDKQRQILGELLFPLVRSRAAENFAPKITGMLIDLSVLEVTEILEFLEDEELLQERISEAAELLRQSGQ